MAFGGVSATVRVENCLFTVRTHTHTHTQTHTHTHTHTHRLAQTKHHRTRSDNQHASGNSIFYVCRVADRVCVHLCAG